MSAKWVELENRILTADDVLNNYPSVLRKGLKIRYEYFSKEKTFGEEYFVTMLAGGWLSTQNFKALTYVKIAMVERKGLIITDHDAFKAKMPN